MAPKVKGKKRPIVVSAERNLSQSESNEWKRATNGREKANPFGGRSLRHCDRNCSVSTQSSPSKSCVGGGGDGERLAAQLAKPTTCLARSCGQLRLLLPVRLTCAPARPTYDFRLATFDLRRKCSLSLRNKNHQIERTRAQWARCKVVRFGGESSEASRDRLGCHWPLARRCTFALRGVRRSRAHLCDSAVAFARRKRACRATCCRATSLTRKLAAAAAAELRPSERRATQHTAALTSHSARQLRAEPSAAWLAGKSSGPSL